MTRKNRDREAERQEIRAAAERLLAGTPLRSPVGELTGTELIAECGLRRDVVYGDHKELVDEFRTRARAQNFTPQVVQNMADENIVLREALTKTKADLAAERERVHALVRAATELSLELGAVPRRTRSGSAGHQASGTERNWTNSRLKLGTFHGAVRTYRRPPLPARAPRPTAHLLATTPLVLLQLEHGRTARP
ncbi:hypothetical protein [Streptomyces sp. H27-C3]|uniref:hypothetical protein n=1 Tax=Streptomyces sp. H27-C3 TaxID=3046305 RepID=UPI0024BBC608|nr:hypothetical protein [Streptomyces sp. H27-C3]MDJ0464285.1 hypothetical protein [Streptomyces sp. H27-C3]